AGGRLGDRDTGRQPWPENTVFFVASDVLRGAVVYTSPVITDFAGEALLGSLPVPPGSYRISAYFGGTVPLPDGQSIPLTDERYRSAVASVIVTYAAVPATLAYIGETVASVQDPLHLAARVTAPGDLTSATAGFALSDASGQPVIEPTRADVCYDG